MKSEEDFDFKRHWKSLSNVGNNSAESKYKIINKKTCRAGYVEGSIKVAFWSESTEDVHTQLHYLRGGNSTITLETLQCTADTQPEHMDITKGSAHWGRGVECESGPALETYNKTATPPTLIINETDGEVFLVVEESSTYPSFLYSVWTAIPQDDDPIELRHKFHIAATVRLAEAVVTGIVHGKPSGKYSFELVRVYSENGTRSDGEITRAEPFGEHPTHDRVKIDDLETIQCGLEVDVKALIFLAFLVVLTSIGVAWSLCLRSSIGMDVYDRDEIIRAVSMSGTGAASGSTTPSTIRIFVRKEDTGCMSVAISETGDSKRGCARVFRFGDKVVEDNNPFPVAAADTVNQYNQGYGGAPVPVGPRTAWLGGVRTGMGRAYPGRRGDFRYPPNIELIAPPTPSNVCSLAATPARNPSPLPHVPWESLGRTGGKDASNLFDTDFSSSDSGENKRDGTKADSSDDIEGGGASNACIVAPGSRAGASAMPQDVHNPEIRGQELVNRDIGHGLVILSSGSTTPEAGEESPPAPLFLQKRELTFGPPQLKSLSKDARG